MVSKDTPGPDSALIRGLVQVLSPSLLQEV